MAKRDPSGNNKFLEFMLQYLYTSTIQAGNLGIGSKDRAQALQKMALENPVSYLTHEYSQPYVNSIEKNVKIFDEKSHIEGLYRHKNIYDYIKNGKKGIWQTDFVIDTIAAENHLSASQRKKLEKQGKKIYEDNKWLVIIPLTHKSSCYYGAGTKWCTTERNSSSHFDTYKRKGELYYIIDKKAEKGNPLQKMALYIAPNTATLFNAPDHQIPMSDISIPEKAILEIIKDGMGKDYPMGKFIREIIQTDGDKYPNLKRLLWDRYKDNPNLLVGALGMEQIGEFMGHEKARKWLRKVAQKGKLSLEYLEDNFDSWATVFPADALLITDATEEYLTPLVTVMGIFELQGEVKKGKYPEKDLKRLEQKFLDDKTMGFKDVTAEAEDKYMLHASLEDVQELFKQPTTAREFMGDEWPDGGFYTEWNPELYETWDLLNDASLHELRLYYMDEYKEEFPETEFMKMDSEELMEFTEDNAPSIEDEIGTSYRIAHDDAVTSLIIDEHFKELSNLFNHPKVQKWYQNKDNKFHFDITPMFWETLTSYAHDHVAHEDEFPYYTWIEMLRDVLEETNELIEIDYNDFYPDDDEIIDAGFNDIFQDRIYMS